MSTDAYWIIGGLVTAVLGLGGVIAKLAFHIKTLSEDAVKAAETHGTEMKEQESKCSSDKEKIREQWRKQVDQLNKDHQTELKGLNEDANKLIVSNIRTLDAIANQHPGIDSDHDIPATEGG